MKFLFKPSKEEAEFVERINNSFKSLRVVGRGTVTVDVQEVQNSPEFKKALARAKELVTNRG